MKILYRGTDPKKKPFNLQCENCKTVVEITPKQFDQNIKCPECDDTITDSVDSRRNAEETLAIEKKKLEKKLEIEREERYRSSHYQSEDYERGSGASGPLPPPELPELPRFVRPLRKLATR